jgi:hypothetical protein
MFNLFKTKPEEKKEIVTGPPTSITPAPKLPEPPMWTVGPSNDGTQIVLCIQHDCTIIRMYMNAEATESLIQSLDSLLQPMLTVLQKNSVLEPFPTIETA